jgi:putative oxidoreductase
MLERVRSTCAPYLYALLRIIAGLLLACHGAQKLFGMFGGFGPPPGATAPLFSLMGLAGIIEFVGGLLIAVGIFTSPVAFIASGEMAFAYFLAHFPRGFWPIQNGGELPVLNCFLFLYIAAHGTGIWGVGKRM